MEDIGVVAKIHSRNGEKITESGSVRMEMALRDVKLFYQKCKVDYDLTVFSFNQKQVIIKMQDRN